MKFSESLKYNAVPEWKQFYLDYPGLKKLIYKLQKRQIGDLSIDHDDNGNGDNEEEEEEEEDDTGVETNYEEQEDEDDFEHHNHGLFEYNEEDFNNFDITQEQLNDLNLFIQKLQYRDEENDSINTVEEQSILVENDNKNQNNINNNNNRKLKKKTDNEFEETYELNDMSGLPSSSSTYEPDNDNNNHNDNDGGNGSNSKKTIRRGIKFINSMKKNNIKLKRLIPNTISKNRDTTENNQNNSHSDGDDDFNPELIFMKRVLFQLLKIDNFYKKTESQFLDNFITLQSDIEKSVHARRPSQHTILNRESNTVNGNNIDGEYDLENGINSDGEDDQEEHTALLDSTDFTIDLQKKSILKKATINLYVDMTQLKSFSELNKIGFAKICKKFDKTLNCFTKKKYVESGVIFDKTYIYSPFVFQELDRKITRLIEFFALITHLTFEESKSEMRSYLRDYIVWERSTVWKDMLGLESSKFNNSSRTDNLLIKEDDLTKLENGNSNIHLEFRKIPIKGTRFVLPVPEFLITTRTLKLVIIIIFTVILLCVETFHDPVQHRCIALLECVALLWATEALPLFVTAMMIPFLETVMLVFKDSTTGKAMSAADAASAAFSAMWSSTIMVLLAGFTLAAALSKYNVAKVLASFLLSLAGTKPRNVLLMIMGVVFFLSMWISNVASPVLTYSLCQPILRTLNADAPFAKALVLGVALAADIGGMPSPISSPQNVFSQSYLKEYGVGWGQFFAVALPTGIFAMVLCWVELCLTYKINQNKIPKFKPIREKFTIKQWYVLFVTLLTILLWCFLTDMEFFGNAGVIAVIPIVLLFGTQLLNGEDLNNFPWSIVILAMGGIALGKGITSSGLLNTIGSSLQEKIQDFSMFAILCIFGIIMLVFGTFVSHTVAAIIIVPLVQEVGDKLPNPKAAPILVFGCTLLASCGMGLASSGFPNITAYGKTDARGKQYLTVNSFITRGVPASFLSFLAVISLGYGIMNSIL